MDLKKALLNSSFLCSLFVSSYALALSCQNPQAQTDINQCAFITLELETKKINKAYNDYMANLNSTKKLQFKNVQLAWIKFKDLACQFEASGVAGGSAFSMVLTSCLIKKTRERNKELEALANCQEGDLSCPAR